jgi:hypothetical protein
MRLIFTFKDSFLKEVKDAEWLNLYRINTTQSFDCPLFDFNMSSTGDWLYSHQNDNKFHFKLR